VRSDFSPPKGKKRSLFREIPPEKSPPKQREDLPRPRTLVKKGLLGHLWRKRIPPQKKKPGKKGERTFAGEGGEEKARDGKESTIFESRGEGSIPQRKEEKNEDFSSGGGTREETKGRESGSVR